MLFQNSFVPVFPHPLDKLTAFFKIKITDLTFKFLHACTSSTCANIQCVIYRFYTFFCQLFFCLLYYALSPGGLILLFNLQLVGVVFWLIHLRVSLLWLLKLVLSFCSCSHFLKMVTFPSPDSVLTEKHTCISFWCSSSTLLINCASDLISMDNHVSPKSGSIMCQTVKQHKAYEISPSASLSDSFSHEESGFVGWQPKASVALFDLSEW